MSDAGRSFFVCVDGAVHAGVVVVVVVVVVVAPVTADGDGSGDREERGGRSRDDIGVSVNRFRKYVRGRAEGWGHIH